VKLKETDTNSNTILVIVDGLFGPEVDVNQYNGCKLHVDVAAALNGNPVTTVVGTIVGAFGKGGKCKATFPIGSVQENTLVRFEGEI
jgi:hypothetical protein